VSKSREACIFFSFPPPPFPLFPPLLFPPYAFLSISSCRLPFAASRVVELQNLPGKFVKSTLGNASFRLFFMNKAVCTVLWLEYYKSVMFHSWIFLSPSTAPFIILPLHICTIAFFFPINTHPFSSPSPKWGPGGFPRKHF
jgi:hypothetical protein